MFKNWLENLRTPNNKPQAFPPGMYSYMAPLDDPLNYRLHLRVESSGKGVLMVNASTILHLNETATEYAYFLVNNLPNYEVIQHFSKRYKTKSSIIENDYQEFKNRIDTLLTSQDLDPVISLDFDRNISSEEEISAPYRLDCAITYTVDSDDISGSSPTKCVDRELTTDEWISIIDKSWANGIPHLLFTGGEPTLREDLPLLLAHAEKNGQVTGLLTNGKKLGDPSYLQKLLQAGLDHTMIVLNPESNSSWEALASFSYWAETLREDIFVAAHLTLTKENSSNIETLIDKIIEAGVSAVSLSENDSTLSGELQKARDYLDDQDIELIWDLPVPYSELNPVSLELAIEKNDESPPGSGKAWLYVEPDGDVLPSQGKNQVLGNILKDDWGTIWNKTKQ